MKFFFLAILLLPPKLYAQWHLNASVGISNYSGDLQDNFFDPDNIYQSLSIGIQYSLNDHISILAGASYCKIGAADKINRNYLQSRNLSFQTEIYEGSLMAEYNLFDLNNHRATPYGFAGIAVYHFDPYTFDQHGNKVFLKPLSTEGQGLPQYPTRVPYNLTQFAVPFGVGIKLRISEGLVLGYEFGFRKLFTDYLDDVSRKYVDKNLLLNAKGPKAVEMAFRTKELKGLSQVPYPKNGEIRGNMKRNDWYYFSGFKVFIDLNVRKKRDQQLRSGIIRCPLK